MLKVFKRIDNWLHELDIPNWLLIFLAILLILRIPTLFEPYSYGDEMIYLTLGEGIKQGKVLYRDIHDNKPPLLYILAAISGSVFWFRALLAFWNTVTIILFWKLAKALFPKNRRLSDISTVIFGILTTIPLWEGHIANSEIFMIGTTIAGFLILLTKKLNFKNLLFAGFLFSLSSLFKIPAAFEVPTIIVYWLITEKRQKGWFKKVFKNSLIFGIGYLIPILLTFVWYFARGAFKEYLVAAFLQNVGYLSAFRPGDVVKPFFVRNAPLLTRAGILVVLTLLLNVLRGKLSKKFIFVSTWLFFALFAVTLSERPYPHYLIQAVPALSLLLGTLVASERKEQVYSIIPISIFFFVPYFFNFWRYPVYGYYKNFVEFASGQTTREEYVESFGSHIPTAYKLAETINMATKRKDPVFVWGNNSSIVYALSRRLPPIKYVAQYHISDFSSPEEVADKLTTTPPKMIIVLQDSPSLDGISTLLRTNYIHIDTIDGSEVWSLLSRQ